MTVLEFCMIFTLGCGASFLGTMVGGSGLITIPGLIFIGLPPQVAIATDQIGLIGESISGWFAFHRAKKIDYSLALPLAFVAAVGATIGACLLVQLPTESVETMVGVLVLLIGILIARNKSIGTQPEVTESRASAIRLGSLYLVVGFWGGLFGAGFGLLSRYVLLLSFRKTFTETAAIGKLISIAVASSAIPIFVWNGLVNWLATAPLLLGMTVGSYFGARYALVIGDEKMRILFLIIVAVSSAKLLLT